MKRSTEKRVVVAFWLALSLLAVARLLFYTNSTSYIDNSQRVERSRETLQEIHATLSSLQDAETGQRGFLLTGDESYLAPWNDGLQTMPRRIARLRELVRHDPQQLARVERADELSRARIDSASATIRLFREQGTAAASDRMRNGRGKAIMDQFRAVMAEMLEAENGKLHDYAEAASSARGRGVTMFGLFVAADVIILSAAFYFIYRYAAARDRAENAVRESASFQQAILDNANNIIITGDTQGVVRSFNRTAERWLGWRAAEIVGRAEYPWLDMNEVTERARKLTKELGRPIETTLDVFVTKTRDRTADEGEWTFISRTGRRFPVRLSVTALRDAEGNITGYCGIGADITEQRRVQEAMQTAKDAAEAANRTKSLFLANMSHELRTPLNAIIGYSEMLAEDAAAQGQTQTVDDLKKINQAGKHLLTLINDILDLSKVEAGKMRLHAETFPVALMMQDVAATIRPMIKQNNNALTIEAPPEVGEMRSDLTKVRQVLFNLLSNSSKFTSNGEIVFAAQRVTSQPVDQIVFTVHDTGIGMESKTMQNLFQAFSQADPATSNKYGGTGLGLAISRQFCRIMGGDIDVQSTPGQGSTFIVTLPAHLSDEEAAASAQEPTPSVHAPGTAAAARTVLVIDDDSPSQDLLRRILEADGFSVATASDGQRGIELARQLHPIAITLDVMMPGMDGWAVLTELKGDPQLCEIPVIMLTMVDDRSMGYALGAGACLTKPVDRAELLRVVDRYRRTRGAQSVLIVEDDTSSADIVKRTLAEAGWDVRLAENGRAGLEQLRENRPSVILLDLMMPLMDGFEFAAELRRHAEWRDIPVIVLTAKELTAEDRKRLDGDVQKILKKGGTRLDEIASVVRDMAGVVR